MADFGSSAKSIFLKAMEGISSAASNVANNTRYKINEMNLTNQRREMLEGFGVKAYELFKAGAEFPPELASILAQVAKLDEQLNEIRVEHQAAREEAAQEKAPQIELEDEEPAAEKAVYGENDDAVPVMEMPEIGLDTEDVAEAVQETAEAAQEAIESAREAKETLTEILDDIAAEDETPEK